MPRTKQEDFEYVTHAYEIYDPIKIGSIDGTDTEPHDRAIVRALHSEYTPNKLVKSDPRHTVFVTRLNPRTTQETIKSEFSKCGKIVSCRLVKDIVTGKSKRYAFVEFDSAISMERAHRHMHKEPIDGAEILVEREAERQLKGWKPRRLGGGFGGRKESGQLRFGCRERPFRRPIMVPVKQETYKVKSIKKEPGEESFNTSKEITSKPVTTDKAIQTMSTLSPDIECTWIPSGQTMAATKYFDSDTTQLENTASTDQKVHSYSQNTVLTTAYYYGEDSFIPDQSDGETADDKKHFVLALIERRAGNVVLFKCILSIVSKYWALTAASCIDSIEEDVYLDQLFMTEKFGKTRPGRIHEVTEIIIHPSYQDVNKTYDIAAIKSKSSLATTKRNVLKLPTVIDYYLITIGERLLILGFGKFRSIKDALPHRVHKAAVHVLPSRQCHVKHPGDTITPICAGVLYARGTPCNYCAGTPLLHRSLLLGIMSANDCGESCEPSLYVNLAIVRDWLRSVIQDK